MGGRVYSLRSNDLSCRLFTKMVLDTIIYCEVNGPRWEITKDCRSEATIESSYAIMLEDRFDGG